MPLRVLDYSAPPTKSTLKIDWGELLRFAIIMAWLVALGWAASRGLARGDDRPAYADPRPATRATTEPSINRANFKVRSGKELRAGLTRRSGNKSDQ